jgi:hypothetical protein
MSYFCETVLKAAGDYLLGLLKSEGAVRYSRYYNEKDGTHEALLRGMGLDEEECDSPECAMDDAVAQLEEAGYVATRTTGDLLMDGHRDYEIALTEEGKTFLASCVALLLRPTKAPPAAQVSHLVQARSRALVAEKPIPGESVPATDRDIRNNAPDSVPRAAKQFDPEKDLLTLLALALQ